MDAERAVLGGLMLDSERLSDVHEIVEPEDFYRETHQKLYQLMVDMSSKGEPVEMVSVVEAIARDGGEGSYGGIAYVSSLSDQVPSTQNLPYYAGIVRERAVARRLIEKSREITAKVMSGEHDLQEVLDYAESSIFQVTQERSARDWHMLSTVVDEQFLRIQQLSERSGDVTGISTGFKDLDAKLAGFQRTDLIILAARPAMGKTALALNLARQAAGTGVGVGVFSLEMSCGQLATRLLCSEAKVDAGKVRTGYLSKERDWPRLTQAAEDLYRLPLYIDDSPGLNIGQLRSKARRLKSKDPTLGLIVVDYIGLMGGDARVSREQQVSASSRGLKALAKELDVAVLCLSQLNRGVENRNPKIPQLADLRESGAIEQDADVIMFIYRDEYYNKERSTKPGIAEIIVAKQRNGPTGSVELSFQGEFTLFGDLARREHSDGYY
jgi:replicative DNA helicase